MITLIEMLSKKVQYAETKLGMFMGPMLLFLICGIQTTGIQADSRLNLRFETFTGSDGLSQNTINCLAQDRRGFLWIGTQEGLNRYDGYEFRIYSTRGGDSSSLSANYINDLALDGEGRLWVATSRGLNLYHDASDHFNRYTHEALSGLGTAFVTALSVDPKGGLWAVTEQKGLYHIDRTLTVHRHFTFDPHDPKGLPENTFWSVLAARDGTLWLGGDQTGLSRLKVVGDRALLLPPITGKVPMDSFIYEVFQANSGTLWVGTRLSGLFRIDPGGMPTAVPLEDPEKGAVASVMGIAEDDKGRIWVGSHGLGVFLIDPTDARVFQHRHRLIDPASLSGDGITSVFKDKTGLMWVGTNAAGLNKHDPGSEIFTHINTRSPQPFHLTENRTHALLHEENTLWAGTFGGGVARFDFDSGSSRVYHWPVGESRSRTFNFVISLYRDRNGVLWAGTYGEGLKVYDPEADAFGALDPDPVKPSATVVAMAEDGAGNLWLGTMTGIETLHPMGKPTRLCRNLEVRVTAPFVFYRRAGVPCGSGSTGRAWAFGRQTKSACV